MNELTFFAVAGAGLIWFLWEQDRHWNLLMVPIVLCSLLLALVSVRQRELAAMELICVRREVMIEVTLALREVGELRRAIELNQMCSEKQRDTKQQALQ
jgi:hypothetical protein